MESEQEHDSIITMPPGTDYKALFNDKERLKDAIIAETIKGFRPDAIDEVREILGLGVSEPVPNILRLGIDPYFLTEVLYNEPTTLSVMCKGCNGLCCRESDPIGISYNDARRIAKSMNLTTKHFIKRFLIRRHKPKSIVVYSLRETRPCWFLNDGRCSIYENRPGVCRQYPAVEVDGKLTLTVEEYCKLPFVACVAATKSAVIGELMKRHDPVAAEALKLMSEKELEAIGVDSKSVKHLPQDQQIAVNHRLTERLRGLHDNGDETKRTT